MVRRPRSWWYPERRWVPSHGGEPPKGIAAYRWQYTQKHKFPDFGGILILIEWGTKEYFQNLWDFHDLIRGSMLNWKNISMIWRTCGTFRYTLPPRVWVVIFVCHMIQHNETFQLQDDWWEPWVWNHYEPTRLSMGWNVVLCFLFVAAQLDLGQPPPRKSSMTLLCNRRILKVSTILTFQILELPNTYHSYHKQKSLNRSCFWSSIPTAYLWGKIHQPSPSPSSKPTISLSSETISCSDFFFGCNKKWPLHTNSKGKPRENHDKTACVLFPLIFRGNQNQKKTSAGSPI